MQEYTILALQSALTTLNGVRLNVIGELEKLSARFACMVGVKVVRLRQGSLKVQVNVATRVWPSVTLAVISKVYTCAGNVAVVNG